jgi:hypothetical protein
VIYFQNPHQNAPLALTTLVSLVLNVMIQNKVHVVATVHVATLVMDVIVNLESPVQRDPVSR